jgi:hypothetical protein
MVDSQKDLRKLPVLSSSGSRSNVLTVSGAKWKKVSISGWRFELSQNAAFALCLTPSGNTTGGQLSGFESPSSEGGGIDLEIQLDEPIDVSGDETTLLVASRASGQDFAVLVECASGSLPPVSKCFKLKSRGEQLRPLRIRLLEENDAPRGLAKALPFLRSKLGKEIVVNDGDTVSISARTTLTAIDDADLGVPITAVAGEKNVGTVIGCEFDAKLWTYEGRGHPSLGVLIWVGVPPGNSVRLAKSIVAVVSHPDQRSNRRMSISLTDSVEEHSGSPPIRR